MEQIHKDLQDIVQILTYGVIIYSVGKLWNWAFKK